MAGASLLTLIDDIASILDDVSLMTKVAARKTVGVLGDDLALNAEQVSGVRAEREIPVVWAVAKGSLVNKAILLPIALVLSYFAPWLVTPLLSCGGMFLCFEGIEKLYHSWLHRKAVKKKSAHPQSPSNERPRVLNEKQKIKGAVRTDFILSAELIIIALGSVQGYPFAEQVVAVCLVAVGLTLGVYGLVAAIVKLDDLGLFLIRKCDAPFLRGLGKGILSTAPYLMKGLSIVGTIAMFLVGGGILLHALPLAHEPMERIHEIVATIPALGGILAKVVELAINGAFGLVAGVLVFLVVAGAKRRFSRS